MAQVVKDVSNAAHNGYFYTLVSTPGVRFVVADGMHRLEAWRRVEKSRRKAMGRVEESRHKEVESKAEPGGVEKPEPIKAWYFNRKDGQALSLDEVHFIGFRQNMMDIERRKKNSMNRVHSCLATLVSTTRLTPADLANRTMSEKERKFVDAVRRKPTSKNLADLVHKREMCDDRNFRSLQRFCTVAIG